MLLEDTKQIMKIFSTKVYNKGRIKGRIKICYGSNIYFTEHKKYGGQIGEKERSSSKFMEKIC